MISEEIIKILILIHAALGGLALLSGVIPITSRKGSTIHKRTGMVFYYSMLGSTIVALFIAVLPGHINPFLFGIGIFTIYLVLGGKLSLRYKTSIDTLLIDKLISIIMIMFGIAMIFGPIVIQQRLNIILAVFGLLGILFSINDLYILSNPVLLKKKWLQLHIVKMVGAYSAAISAFLVVNSVFQNLVNWFGAGLLGGLYMYYWLRKLKKQKRIIIQSQ